MDDYKFRKLKQRRYCERTGRSEFAECTSIAEIAYVLELKRKGLLDCTGSKISRLSEDVSEKNLGRSFESLDDVLVQDDDSAKGIVYIAKYLRRKIPLGIGGAFRSAIKYYDISDGIIYEVDDISDIANVDVLPCSTLPFKKDYVPELFYSTPDDVRGVRDSSKRCGGDVSPILQMFEYGGRPWGISAGGSIVDLEKDAVVAEFGGGDFLASISCDGDDIFAIISGAASRRNELWKLDCDFSKLRMIDYCPGELTRDSVLRTFRWNAVDFLNSNGSNLYLNNIWRIDAPEGFGNFKTFDVLGKYDGKLQVASANRSNSRLYLWNLDLGSLEIDVLDCIDSASNIHGVSVVRDGCVRDMLIAASSD